jgi:drug/metabolite transporter (DMT)-like permease
VGPTHPGEENRLRGSLIVRTRTEVTTTVAALTVAVLAVSSSGPMIAYAAAPAVAIAFWRTALAAGVLAPVAAIGRRAELRSLAGPARREGLFTVLAGFALAAHFLTWVPSVKLTGIATAIALCATQPVWQGLIAVGQGRRLSRPMWIGIAIAVLGAVAATGADVSVSATAVLGDLLALGGGMAVAVYTALGERVRATTSTTSYTAVCYAVCAVLILVVCLVAGVPLAGYPAGAWFAIVGITVGPQLLGHSLFSYALRRVSATTIAVVILLEVPGTILIGWLWLGQAPRPGAWPGLALLVLGVAIVVLSGRARARPRPGPESLID